MEIGDQVRVWKQNDEIPIGSIGIIMESHEQDFNDDSWVEHLKVDFGGKEIWLTDNDVAVVGDWKDEMYLRQEAIREEQEKKTRNIIQNLILTLRAISEQ